MQSLLTLLLICCLLSSCSSERANTAAITETETNSDHTRSNSYPSDTSDFKKAFKQFFTALQQSDTATLNRFIHPEHGLWIIEQPGAVPKMTNVIRIQNFKREYQDRSFFTIAPEVQSCDLTQASFPDFDCADMNYDAGKTGYAQDGCFVWKADKFKKSGYWNYASLTQGQIDQIQNTLPLLERSVLHTSSSYEFHFGYLDSRWHLLFAKIIYPCSA